MFHSVGAQIAVSEKDETSERMFLFARAQLETDFFFFFWNSGKM